MRAFALVLLVAASAFAAPSYAPSVSVNQNLIGEFPLPYDDGRPVNGAVMEGTWEMCDAAGTSVNVNALHQVLNDLAEQQEPLAQAIAVAGTLATVGELSYGIPGDSCAAAFAINNFAEGGSAASFMPIIPQHINNLRLISQNPLALRYASGPVGGCVGGGRNYEFEATWDRILARVPPQSAELMYELYCTMRRLYTANSVADNNVAAATTAAAAMASEGVFDHVAHAGILRSIAFN